MSKSPPSLDQPFTAFSFLWAVSGLFNLLARMGLTDPISFRFEMLSVAAAVGLLIKPSSLNRLCLFAAIYAATSWSKMPNMNNHAVLIFFFNLTFIITFLSRLTRNVVNKWGVAPAPTQVSTRKRARPRWLSPFLDKLSQVQVSRSDFFQTMAPSMRLSILILYFWATIHKLNEGFLMPELSCAVMQFQALRQAKILGVPMDFLPTGPTIYVLSIYGTLAVEMAIPVLLCFGKTRIAGVLMALIFHCILGYQYSDFSSLLYVLFSLFLPLSFWENLDHWWQTTRLRPSWVARFRRPWQLTRFSLGISLAAWVVMLLVFLPWEQMVLGFQMNQIWKSKAQGMIHLWFVYAFLLILVFMRILFVNQRKQVQSHGGSLRPPLITAVVPILIFFNGLCPHLGLKTTLSFAMFSNLRTEEGQTNHLFIPASWQIWSYHQDLVTIHYSSDALLRSYAVPTWRTLSDRGFPNIATFILKSHDLIQSRPRPSWKLPYIGLRLRVSHLAKTGKKNVRLNYERNGQIVRLEKAESDPELSATPYWMRKFIRVRFVPNIEAGCCMW